MKHIALLNFVYPNAVTEVDKAELYNSMGEASARLSISAFVFAFCAILGVYLVLVAVCWWVDYRGMVGTLPLFKIATFGIGDAKRVKPLPFFGITIGIYLGIIGIVSGLLPQLIAKIMEWILKTIRITDLFKL